MPSSKVSLQPGMFVAITGLPQAALSSLFAMTPYYYRTSKEGVARLAATEALDVLAQMDIHVYQKGE